MKVVSLHKGKTIMPRLPRISVEQATAPTSELYAAIKKHLGVVPNLFQTLGAHPQALEAYLHLDSGLTTLSGPDKEAISLTVAEANGCDYCLAAHTVLGKMRGLAPEEMLKIRQGHATDPKRNALIRLVREIVEKKGAVSDETFQGFLDAGYSTSQVPAVMLAVVQNVFTNYFNNLNGTEIDFPAAPAL
jgi:AhpD family alkylhydroperoxidase